MAADGAADQKCAPQIDVHDALPMGQLLIDRSHDRLGDPGAIDENVDGARPRDGVCDQGLDAVFSADIAGDGDGILCKAACGRFETQLVPIAGHDWAPPWARRSAIARPIPPAAPVTNAVSPSNSDLAVVMRWPFGKARDLIARGMPERARGDRR